MKFVYWIFAVCLFAASFDRLLLLDIGGSIRISQMFMVLVLLAAIARIIQDGRVLWPTSFTALSIWVFWQAMCLPLSGAINIGLQFFVLLLFTVAGILAVVQIWGLDDRIEQLMRLYMASFIFVGAYGAFQFLLPLTTGITAPFTVMWLKHGRVARINGFSFEPSYFATYLFLGWIMLADLRLSKAAIAAGSRMRWITWSLAAVLFLSSSKTAWLAMIIEVLARLAPPTWRVLRRAVNSLRHGKLLVPVPGSHLPRYILLVVVGCIALSYGASKADIGETTLLAGTGIGGSAAHSYNDRFSAASVTFESFRTSPWIGRSLGGVAVANAAISGIVVTNMTQARLYWGFPVLLDVLVASGLIGFVPFLYFLWQNTFGAWRLAMSYFPDERAKWLRALARAMIFEWILLLSDQNLMRVYLWLHFAMIAVVSYHLQYGPSLATIAARQKAKLLAQPVSEPYSPALIPGEATS